MFKCQLNFNKVHDSPCKYETEQGKILIFPHQNLAELERYLAPSPSS